MNPNTDPTAPVQGLPVISQSPAEIATEAVAAAGQAAREKTAELVAGLRHRGPVRSLKAIAKDQGALLKEEGHAVLRALNPFSKSKGTFLKFAVTILYFLVLTAIGAVAAYHHQIGRHIGAETEVGEKVTYWMGVAEAETLNARAAEIDGNFERATEHKTNVRTAYTNAWNHVEKPGVFRRAASAIFGK